MKAGAKARFSKVVDIAEDREFWRKGKAFVELQVCGPIMNLLRKADSDNSGTGKVYHENFKFCKILQSMTDSPEFDFIPRVCARYFHQYPIKMGWLYGQISTIRYMVQDTASIQRFTHIITLHEPRR